MSLTAGVLILAAVGLLAYGFYNRAREAEEFERGAEGESTFAIVSSYLSTNIGGGSLLALTAIAFDGGFAAVYLAASYTTFLLLLSIAAPKIFRFSREQDCTSFGDFADFFYRSRRVANSIDVIKFVAFFLFFVSQILAMKILLSVVVGLSDIAGIIISGLYFLAFGLLGGLKVDIRTDMIQFVLLGLTLLYFVIYIGTQERLKGVVDAISDPGRLTGIAYEGPGFLATLVIVVGPSLLCSLDLWQRIIASRSERAAKRALWYSAPGLLLSFLALAYIGMSLRVINPSVEADEAFFGYAMTGPEIAAITFTLLGLVAITSTADSMLVVASTSLRSLRTQFGAPKAKIGTIRSYNVIIAVLCVVVATLFSDLVMTLVNAFSSMAILLPAMLMPLLGVRRERAAFWSVVIGMLAFSASTVLRYEYSNLVSVLLAFVTYFALSPFERDVGAK